MSRWPTSRRGRRRPWRTRRRPCRTGARPRRGLPSSKSMYRAAGRFLVELGVAGGVLEQRLGGGGVVLDSAGPGAGASRRRPGRPRGPAGRTRRPASSRPRARLIRLRRRRTAVESGSLARAFSSGLDRVAELAALLERPGRRRNSGATRPASAPRPSGAGRGRTARGGSSPGRAKSAGASFGPGSGGPASGPGAGRRRSPAEATPRASESGGDGTGRA